MIVTSSYFFKFHFDAKHQWLSWSLSR
jgi:hypothetical protein